MKTTMKQSRIAIKALPLLIAAALTWPLAANAGGPKALEGTWDVTVTLRNCESDAEIRSFPRMVTFHKGGTLTEWAAAGTELQSTNRSVGQGTWGFLGHRGFTYSLKFLRLTPFGGPDGSVAEQYQLEVESSGLGYAAKGIARITRGDGVVIGPLCLSEAGVKVF
jgi:hypothetical protein